MRRGTLILFFLGFSFLAFGSQSLAPKDLVVVLDTSLSMVGKGNGNEDIFESVKAEISEIILRLEIGDTFTLIEFGTFVKQSDRRIILSEDDKKKFVEEVRGIEAKSLWTYTGLMFRNLAKTINDIGSESPDRVQLALIFSDAKDDPPLPHNRLNLADKAERCNPEQNSGNQYIFYFSVLPKSNDGVVQSLLNCFPEAGHYEIGGTDVNQPRAVEDVSATVFSSLVPSVIITGEKIFVSEPGREAVRGELSFESNRAASGTLLKLGLGVHSEDISGVVFDSTEVQLEEGISTVGFSFDVDKRAESDLELTALISVVGQVALGEVRLLPEGANATRVAVNVAPWSFSEKLTRLPEFYVPLLLIFLAIIYGLFRWYQFLMFVPVLRLTYWETPSDGDFRESDRKKLILKTRRKLKKGEVMPDLEFPEQNPLKDEINFLEEDAGNYFISSGSQNLDDSGDPPPNLVLNGFAPNETIHLKIIGKKRRTRVKVLGQWKRKIKRKEKFNSPFFRNGTYFTFGPYSFEVETNLPK